MALKISIFLVFIAHANEGEYSLSAKFGYCDFSPEPKIGIPELLNTIFIHWYKFSIDPAIQVNIWNLDWGKIMKTHFLQRLDFSPRHKILINVNKCFAAKIVLVDMKQSTTHAITGRAILLGNATAILIFAILAIWILAMLLRILPSYYYGFHLEHFLP